MSLLHSFYCWGQVAVVGLSTLFFVTAGVGNWPILACVWAAVPLLNAVFFAFVPVYKLVEEGEALPASRLLKTRTFWLFFVLMLCAGSCELAVSQWASAFAESGLGVSKTVGDLLAYYPRGYDVYREPVAIGQVKDQERAAVTGTVSGSVTAE